MVFFIPWRVVAEHSGAAPLDLLGPPGWCSGCWPHDGDVAGGAGFLLSDIPVRGRRWSSGDRSDRRCGRCGATGSTAPTALIESRVDWAAACSLSDISGLARWCSLSLGGWSPKALARRISTCSGRLGGAAAAGRTMVMSPAAPDSFFAYSVRGELELGGVRAIAASPPPQPRSPTMWRRRFCGERGKAAH